MKRKEEIRILAREKDKSLSEEYRISSGKKIIETIIKMPAYHEACVIFCFAGVRSEIDTKLLLVDALSNEKTLGLPKCRENNEMDVFSIRNLSELQKGFYGLLEPNDSCRLIAPEKIDLCIVPCLACDKEGRRMGKGGGYYDRYLSRCNGLKICVCREALILDEVPVDSFDVQMDIVVTEKNVYFYG